MRSWLASCALFAYFHLELVSSSLDVFGHARRFRRIRRGSTDDIELLGERRFPAIAANSEGSAANVGTWLGTLEENGQWPASEVNYGTGCDAQRSNWPAQDHWSRIVTMSAAWHGGLSGAEEWAQNDTLRDAISLAMEYWFANDMALPQCADHGGDNLCPCGTPGFWNTNWYGNFIGVPTLVEEACVMLNGSLTETEFGNCSVFAYRSFDSMETGINGGSTTGANSLDISSIAVDFGIVSANATLLTEAFDDIHKDVVIINEKKADGIRADGAFSQHLGLIYNGNYGKDYFNDVLNLEVIAGGTQYAASQESRDAVTTLVEGNSWMIYVNTLTGVLHWDYSVIGRFIAVPVADNAASASIHTNLTKVQVLADEWDSSEMRQYYEALTSESDNANIGGVQGNRMFYTLDYMVHRGPGYVTTLKMLSKRTQTSECTNSQSPYGFHLSDGAMFTYMDGDEYEDIFASWDWNLIPGITVDYNATVLACNSAGASGTQDLAGGVSNGEIGVAAMHYKTPKSKSLESRKAWFFLPNDVQHVMIASINSTTNASVFSVLDQRLHSGDIFVDGKREIEGNFTGVSTLFHGGVGYAFNQSNNAVSLSIQSGERTGNWSTLSASKQGLETVDLFSAWLYHEDPSEPAEYTIFPATTKHSFSKKLHETDLITLSNDDMVSALLDRSNGIVMSVFWEAEGGEMTIPGDDPWAASVTVTSDGNVALIIDLCDFYLTVSDPSQALANVTLTFTVDDDGYPPHGWQGHDSTASVTIQLPSGGLNGSSVSTALF